jgi:hypothetical protein
MTLVPAYTPTDWVDNVTPVDEAHMDKIDTAIGQHATAINSLDTRLAAEEAMPDIPAVVNGQWIKGSSGAMVWSAITQADVSGLTAALSAKEATANKGVANGYASLDSGGKIPSAQLPVSIDLRWAGSYAGATAYKEGDVVIYNGVSYMALRPTTGETPQPWSTGAGGLTTLSAAAAADTAVSAANTWTDIVLPAPGPAFALTQGTWVIVGQIDIQMGAGGSGNVAVRLYDGTTIYAAAEAYAIAASQALSFPLVAQIVVGAGGISLKMQNFSTRAGATAKAALVVNAGNPGSTSMTAIKVA